MRLFLLLNLGFAFLFLQRVNTKQPLLVGGRVPASMDIYGHHMIMDLIGLLATPFEIGFQLPFHLLDNFK